MASTTFRFQAPSGLTLTGYFFSIGGTGTPAASYTPVEYSDSGWYSFAYPEALEGIFFFWARDASSTVVTKLAIVQDDTGQYFGFDPGWPIHYMTLPWNAAWDAEVQSEVTDALTSYDVATESTATEAKDQATIAAINVQR